MNQRIKCFLKIEINNIDQLPVLYGELPILEAIEEVSAGGFTCQESMLVFRNQIVSMKVGLRVGRGQHFP